MVNPSQWTSADDTARVVRLFAVIGRVDLELAVRCLGISRTAVDDIVTRLEGLDLDAGVLRLTPDAARSVLEEASPTDLDETLGQVLDLVVSRPGVDPDIVLNLVDRGCSDPRLTDPVLQIDAAAPDEQTHTAMRVHALGRRLGWSVAETALRRAEAVLAEGRIDRCMTLCDQVIETGEPADVARAIELSAMAEARLGNLDRAVDLHRMNPPTAHDAVVAAVSSALGAGSVEDLHAFAAREGAGPMSTGGWSGLFVQGMVASVEADGAAGVAGLVRAGQAVRYAGRASRVLPHTPATLAASAALGQGDPVVATAVLEQALAGQVGGEHGRLAHVIGLAWTAMITGDVPRALELTADLDPDRFRSPVQAIQLRVIRVGIARRQSDAAALGAAWRAVRGEILALPVDLFTLPLLGELHVAGARVGDPSRLDPQMERGVKLLAELGNPPVWSTQFHWAGVQAAILGQRPERLRPHASALAANANRSDFARRLAEAGQAWLDVLRGEVDTVRITAAVTAIAEVGLVWDASRLAGFAATRCGDPAAARDMLRLARSVDRLRLGDDGGDTTDISAVLTERELNVSRLVLQGLGYREIGQRLFISPRTVEHHVARVRRRLGAVDRRDMFERLREILD